MFKKSVKVTGMLVADGDEFFFFWQCVGLETTTFLLLTLLNIDRLKKCLLADSATNLSYF